ncbi:MAG: FtsX-like permease family protein [Clostridiaceae bacterium]|nr:FtsX-like permease family protein [Clostridiaceae bacterium]
MAQKSFVKDLIRSIYNTKARFLSIMAIIALGVGFFAGINATEPDMILSANRYYQEHNLSDFRLVSALGFEAGDIERVRETEGVKIVQEGYSKDLFLNSSEGTATTIRLFSYDQADYQQNDGLNQPVLVEGRMPEQTGEIALDHGLNLPDEIKVGSVVTLSVAEGETASDYLKTETFTVVGLINSPMYIDYERGQTNIGDGSISLFAYIGKADFKIEKVTDLFIRTTDSINLSAYTAAYETRLSSVDDRLTALGLEIVSADTQEMRDKLEQSKRDLQTNKDKAEQELADGEQKLRDAEQKLLDGEQELNDQEKTNTEKLAQQKTKLAQAKKELKEGQDLYNSQYALWAEQESAYQKNLSVMAATKAQLDDAQSQISQSEQELAAAKIQLDSSKAQLDSLQQATGALSAIEASLPAVIPGMTEEQYHQWTEQIRVISPDLANTIQQQFSYGDANLTAELAGAISQTLTPMNTAYQEGTAAYQAGLAQYEAGYQQLESSKAQVAQGLADYNSGLAQMEAGRAQLDSGKAALDQAKATLTAGGLKIKQGAKALADGEKELADALAEGRQKLIDGRVELADARSQYETEKTDAMQKIADAEVKINDAESQMLEIPDNWFIFTRVSNPGYSSYGDDAKRIGAVAKVFPLFFFLVAALVCLTTMTRMVEEERVQIGTLKAIGYGALKISAKYLVYALLASLIGALTGLIIGFQLFPGLIMNAYGIMYRIPVRLSPFHYNYAVLSILMAVVTTVSVTLMATLQELRATPAVLMQPKAPKPGKRIFLERIRFIWKKLSFSHKVTARNLFRYKKRFLMTAIGVAGCTALLVTGFGLKDSINAILGKQFDEIFLYDAQVALDTEQEGAADHLTAYLDSQESTDAYLKTALETVTALSNQTDRSYEANLLVPEDTGRLTTFYNLHTRRGKSAIDLPADGAVITEKLSNLLHVGVGDTISLRDTENRTYDIKIAAIAENYLSHYIYLSPDYYSQITYRTPVYNTVALNIKNPDSIDVKTYKENLMTVDGVLGAFFSRSLADDFKDTMKNLDYVVLILIVSAGALAFVVLYNLTNINITERIREIATIKVLGFRDKEVSAYVYRENILLTLIGTAGGLLLGLLLHRFVIGTMEIDTMMFGKDVQWLSYILSVALTMIFSALVNFFMYYKLRKINMVESLKSIE